jgi:hypothetical protein
VEHAGAGDIRGVACAAGHALRRVDSRHTRADDAELGIRSPRNRLERRHLDDARLHAPFDLDGRRNESARLCA